METANCRVFVVLLTLLHFVSTETTKEAKTMQSKTTHKMLSEVTTTSTPSSLNANLNSMWVYRPNSYHSQMPDDFVERRAIFSAPHSLTKLAKTFAMDFNPYFSKGYFEPFEWRPRPVTLVALRKNGYVPRRTVKIEETKSTEVAELQSPYNDVGNFWQDEPREPQK